MGWTLPRTWETNELVTASVLNEQVRDNLTYLASRPSAFTKGGSADYYTTSAAWTDIDAANLQKTITVQAGGRVLAWFYGTIYVANSNQIVGLRLVMNGVDMAGRTYGHTLSMTPYDTPFCIQVLLENQSAGTQTWKPQWFVTGGVAARIFKTNVQVGFGVLEL